MNVAVIGLGSMGKRRIRLIKKYDEKINIIGIDLNNRRCLEVTDEFKIETCSSLDEAINKYNISSVFISTSPLSHANIINQCLNVGLNVFTELNLVDTGYDENIKLAKEKGCILFISSTFLYRAEVEYIKNITENSKSNICYNYHIGQYLPDWHPWENYKDFFISDKKTNGCREIFAIELPWLISTFGKIKDFKVVKNKISSLDINYPDNYMILLQHESGHNGVLCVDVVSRKAVRNLELYSEEMYLHWDGSPKGLYLFDIENKQDKNINLYNKIDKLDNYSSNIIENAYYNEIEEYFGCIKGNKKPRHTFEKDKEILDIISALESEI